MPVKRACYAGRSLCPRCDERWPTRQLRFHGPLLADKRVRIISRMMLQQLLQVCREELRKAKPAIIAAYEIVREADERALQTLLLFFQDR
jgi:hypothetical protein